MSYRNWFSWGSALKKKLPEGQKAKRFLCSLIEGPLLTTFTTFSNTKLRAGIFLFSKPHVYYYCGLFDRTTIDVLRNKKSTSINFIREVEGERENTKIKEMDCREAISEIIVIIYRRRCHKRIKIFAIQVRNDDETWYLQIIRTSIFDLMKTRQKTSSKDFDCYHLYELYGNETKLR